jgi:hypothetical protein
MFALASNCTGAQSGKREHLEKISPDLVALFDAYTAASRRGAVFTPQTCCSRSWSSMIGCWSMPSRRVVPARSRPISAGHIVSGQLPIAAITATGLS